MGDLKQLSTWILILSRCSIMSCCGGNYFQVSHINLEECNSLEVVYIASKIECTLRCKRNKMAAFKDGKCFCVDPTNCTLSHDANLSVGEKENNAIAMVRNKKEEEFAFEIPRHTVDVPTLPDKLLPFNNQLSYTYWVYLTAYSSAHIFTVPINHNVQNSITQPMISQTTITQVFKHVVRSTSYTVPLKKWTHVAITTDFNGGIMTICWYVDGKKIDESISNATPNNIPDGDVFKGLVFGNDVDYASVDDPSQSFLGKVTELYLFNSVLSAKQIEDIYKHCHIPTENRIFSWVEMKGKANEKDVKTVEYPYEILDKH